MPSTLNTGPVEFAHKLVTQRKYGGFLPSNYHVTDGYIWHDQNVIPTPNEVDVFDVIGMKYMPPEKRENFA